METLKVHIKGTAPLLMHSIRGANPLDSDAKVLKQLTSKRKKTEEDHILLLEADWHVGIYHDDKVGAYVPGEAVFACLVGGAKLQKNGASFKRGLQILDIKCPIIHKGGKTKKELFDDKRFVDVRMVTVNRNKIPRCRPIFEEWELKFSVVYTDEMVQKDDVLKAIEDSGRFIGLLDYRPRYGRFEVVSIS